MNFKVVIGTSFKYHHKKAVSLSIIDRSFILHFIELNYSVHTFLKLL
jgi:hypothetical protein